MNNSAPGTTFFSGSVFAMQLSARFWRVHMSWKFIYILLLLHAPTRLWIWLLGLAFSWGRWRLKLKGGPCLAGGGWLHWFSSQWNDSRKWELDQHLFCNRFGSFFGFPPLIQVWWGSSSQLFSSFWIVCSFPRNKNNILPWNMWNSSHDSWLHPASRGFEMLRVVSWPENHIKEHPSLS